jgi:dTDP-D-glucose 4,6-dehydratase
VRSLVPGHDAVINFAAETHVDRSISGAAPFVATYGLDMRITRCCNNYGPYQYPEKVIPLFVTNLLDGQQVPLYGEHDRRYCLEDTVRWYADHRSWWEPLRRPVAAVTGGVR